MKIMKLVPGFAALTLACATTVGSMYVTLSAAAENEAANATVIEEGEIATDLTGITLAARLAGRISTITPGSGDLVPASGVSVSLAPANGQGIVSASTDAEGVYALGEVGTGAYTLSANSSQGLMTFGVIVSGNALAENQNNALTPVSLKLDSQDIQLNSTLVPAGDISAVRAIVAAAVGARIAAVPEGDESDAVLTSQPVLAINDPPTAYAHEQVQLNANGGLDGHVRLIDGTSLQIAPVNDLRVHLVSDGVEATSARVNRDGSFSVPSVLPGVYSMVVAGTDGISASGIDVVGNFAANGNPLNGEFKLASVTRAAAAASTAVISGQGGAAAAGLGVGNGGSDGGGGAPPIVGGPPGGPFPTGPAPFGPGGFPGGIPGGGGGFAGGGGGFGGGGGLGALLGIGAAAAIAAAIVDDDDRPAASP